MKVALFSNSYLPYLSGITLSIKTLKDELRHLGHTAYVVGPRYPRHVEDDPKVLRLPSLPATYPGYRFVFPYSPWVFSALKKEQIELIHAHQPFGVGLAALSLARRMRIPFVYSFHTFFSRYVHHAPLIPQRLAKWAVTAYLSFFCRQADTVIVPSEMVRRLLVSRKVNKPIEVIPTGIKLRKIKQRKEIGNQRLNIRKKHQIPPDAKILLYSGRLSEEKNVPFLLEAFPLIRAQDENLYFILVGGGPKGTEYRAIAKDNHIIFTGQIPHAEVLDYYLASDLFVYASITETQGLVLTEAKACGLPVVALFGGGISDVIESGIDGYIVRRDQRAFVEHALRLLKDDDLRRHMSIKAKEDAHDRFSSLAVAKRVESVYNSLIKSKGA
jgi:glycosyltransferase involved in cell wall biosynthesis